jgi:hypothetical protein
MPPMRRARVGIVGRHGLWALGLLLATHRGAGAAPDAFMAVGDPLEAELRILDLTAPGVAADRILLPHLHTRPLQWRELQGADPPSGATSALRSISLARLERALGRHALPAFAPHPVQHATPFLWQSEAAAQSFELSLGIEGRAETDRFDSRVSSGSGAQARIAAAFDHWLVYSHLLLGHVDDARSFADPLFPGGDVILHTEDTYIAYTGNEGRWGARLGRSRWHWGPGEEASLAISKTSPAFTGMAVRARLEPLHADAFTLSGTLDQSAGEQLAAHRLEWQPAGSVRVGLTETARYRAPGWQPLYLIGVIPYILVQRLGAQEHPDTLGTQRNNVMLSLDLAWRPVSGTRFYGELLIDDLHAESSANPNKVAFQLGWEGVGALGGTRMSWGGEYTRLARYVYTSTFGRAYEAQGRSIGTPTGPDARRLSLRFAWDPGTDWQLAARVAQTDKGENDLDEPYVPGSPQFKPFSFEGVVEQARAAELGLRWWPASGVDLSAWAGYRWTENAGTVAGVEHETPTATVEVRLTR